MVRIQNIKISAYADYRITCVISTRKEFCTFMLEKHKSAIKNGGVDGEYIRMYAMDGREATYGIMFLDSKAPRKARLKTLVHESQHASQYILHLLNIKTTAKNHESLAYLQDYIFGEIYKKNINFFTG